MMVFATIAAFGKKSKDDSKYLVGAVPEVNGMVTFTKSFRVNNHSTADIHKVMQQFVGNLVENSISAPGNYARIMDDKDNCITARVCEWLVFNKKPLNLDRARFRYQIEAKTEGDRVNITVTNITYYYNEDMETNNGFIIKAEEWITDREALNKKQTKLYPKSGKFRRKTVDRANGIFSAAMDAFEPKEEPVAKPVRKGVVED